MIPFVNGQDFTEKELDGIYKGLRQGAYYERKAKEQENALKLFDSLTSGMAKRLEIAVEKEKNYLRIIDNKDRNYEALESLGELQVKQTKVRSRKKTVVIAIATTVVGIYIGSKLN